MDESIKTLDIAGGGDGGPPATSDDLQVREQLPFLLIVYFAGRVV